MPPTDEHPDDHIRAAQAAAAYRSHDPAQSAGHRISFEDEELDAEPAPPPRTERPPTRRPLLLGLQSPFLTAFLVSLGWSAGQALVRILALLFVLGLGGLLAWRLASGL
jgi:hypothetical protein